MYMPKNRFRIDETSPSNILLSVCRHPGWVYRSVCFYMRVVIIGASVDEGVWFLAIICHSKSLGAEYMSGAVGLSRFLTSSSSSCWDYYYRKLHSFSVRLIMGGSAAGLHSARSGLPKGPGELKVATN